MHIYSEMFTVFSGAYWYMQLNMLRIAGYVNLYPFRRKDFMQEEEVVKFLTLWQHMAFKIPSKNKKAGYWQVAESAGRWK